MIETEKLYVILSREDEEDEAEQIKTADKFTEQEVKNYYINYFASEEELGQVENMTEQELRSCFNWVGYLLINVTSIEED